MKNRIMYIWIVLTIGFTSCEDIVEVKLSEEEVEFYAVEAKITTEENPFIFLYKSQKYKEIIPTYCNDFHAFATIYLGKDTNLMCILGVMKRNYS